MSNIAETYKRLSPLLKFYFKKNPGTLYPFLFLYLAREGKLLVEDRMRHIDYATIDDKLKGNIISQFTKEDAVELSLKDNAGRHLLEKWETNSKIQLSLIAPKVNEDEYLQEIREVIQRHDDEIITTMEQRHALFLLAQGLLAMGRKQLKDDYVSLFFIIFMHTELKAENMNLAYLESILIDDIVEEDECYYAYQAYSNYSFLPIFQQGFEFIEEVSGSDAEIREALCKLLYIDSENSRVVRTEKWLQAKKYLKENEVYKLIICNSTYVNKDKETTYHYALKNTLDLLSEDGSFIGMMDVKSYFENTTRKKLFIKLAEEGRIKRVVLLPKKFNKVIVEIVGDEVSCPMITLVNLYNESLPDISISREDYRRFLARNSREITGYELASRNYSIGDFFMYSLPEKDGFSIVKLSRLISRIEKCASSIGDDDSFNSSYEYLGSAEHDYSPFRPIVSGQACSDLGIYEPVYLLDDDALVVNKEGDLKPRLYEYDSRPAIFRYGLAFKVKNNTYPLYLINELRKQYVKDQLDDWSRNPEGKHSEDEILGLSIYCPIDENGKLSKEEERKICSNELDESILPAGLKISAEDGTTYIIEEKLGNGWFGISYKANRVNRLRSVQQKVVLKEFFVRIDDMTHRKGIVTEHKIGSIQSIKNNLDGAAEKKRFIEEAERMLMFGEIKDSHIRAARNLFSCSETNNIYYETDFFDNGTLQDLVDKEGPYDEKSAIFRIIIPLCKAVNVLHSKRFLHRDIKPENILIDDEGYALLGDLGISKEYDENGNELSYGERQSRSAFTPEEPFDDRVFLPEVDIFAVGMVYVYVLTGTTDPSRLRDCKVSEKSIKAIQYAIKDTLSDGDFSIMDFVHMLPWCEDAEFSFSEKTEEEREMEALYDAINRDKYQEDLEFLANQYEE